ncbi:MAG: hypothetical protein U0360_05335 [Dehalococcoidia bacterium]
MNTPTRFVVAAAAILLTASFATLPVSADDDVPVAPTAAVDAGDVPELFPAPTPAPALALVVVDGGSSAEVVSSLGCPGGNPALYWTYVDGQFVRFSPSWDALQRDPWESAFSSGIPSMTPIGVDCR